MSGLFRPQILSQNLSKITILDTGLVLLKVATIHYFINFTWRYGAVNGSQCLLSTSLLLIFLTFYRRTGVHHYYYYLAAISGDVT